MRKVRKGKEKKAGEKAGGMSKRIMMTERAEETLTRSQPGTKELEKAGMVKAKA
jgi:hypothetical protein